MGKYHDRAARLAANKLGSKYDPTDSPDVKKGARGRAEAKSRASEVPTALDQLGPGKGRAYVVLPKSEHEKARERLLGTGIGLMDYTSKITKRSRSARKKI
ncbi:unnamed protein product [marine sediment metagenome]|uniref:Uncharacterized protein n=1 Tax=marine sediment metagenome TaxID=412755 RepID=X1C1Z8_9ZZZZ